MRGRFRDYARDALTGIAEGDDIVQTTTFCPMKIGVVRKSLGSNPIRVQVPSRPLDLTVRYKEVVLESIRVVSSVGLEHLVYIQGVGGSSPSLPIF